MRTHYGARYSVCGLGSRATTNTSNVDCQRCRLTADFRAAERWQREEGTAVGSPVQTSERETMQKAVDLVMAEANRIAIEQGYCSTYDEIVAAMSLPHGLVVKPRAQEWRIVLETEWPVNEIDSLFDAERRVREILPEGYAVISAERVE